MRNKLNALHKRYVKNPTNLSYKIIFSRERAIYKKKLKKAKRDSWLKYCEGTSETYGKIFKIAREKILKNTDLVHTLMEQSGEFDGYEDVLELLIKEHFLTNTQVNNVLNIIDESIVAPDQELLSNREFKYSSDSIKNNKASGFDYIDGR